MKTAKVFLLAMVVLLLPVYAHSAPLGSARISFLEGDVQMRTTDAGDWVPAAINTPLDEGDELWVPAEILEAIKKEGMSKEKVSSYEMSQLGMAFNIGENPVTPGIALKITN